jgi:hypothetical protein
MYLVLFAIGLLITAAGLLTIGFGIPINAFSLGNTLIISGTVAVVGGLVIMGLGAAIRQLHRISVALNSRPMVRPAAPGAIAASAQAAAPVAGEPVADTLVPPTARIPQAPVRAPAPIPPAPRPAVEPRFPAAAEPSSSPLDWLRSKPKSETPPLAAEPPVMDVGDEAPLSPRAPQRPMFSPPPAAPSPSIEPSIEPKAWVPPSRSNGTHEHKEPSFKDPRADLPPISAPRLEQIARTSAPERARDISRDTAKPAGKDAGLFDVVWPDARSKTGPGAEPASREPMQREPVQREPKFDPTPPQRPREEPSAEKRAEPAAASERPAAILKSGVIDGMAYTLYADGSIEAELPQGTVRFASVDALRAHLEKSV